MFLENNEIYGWSNQAGGGGCPCQYAGCTDPSANNYDATATQDDGSCTYNGMCYPQSCLGVGQPAPAVSFTNLPASMDCTAVSAIHQNTPANCGTAPNTGSGTGTTSPTRNFTGGGYSNFNQQGFGGYNDRMWFNARGRSAMFMPPRPMPPMTKTGRGSRPMGTSRVDELIGCKECRTSYDCVLSRPDGTEISRCSQGCCVYTPFASRTDDRMNRFSGNGFTSY